MLYNIDINIDGNIDDRIDNIIDDRNNLIHTHTSSTRTRRGGSCLRLWL